MLRATISRIPNSGSGLLLSLILVAMLPVSTYAQIGGVDLDTVRAGPLDNGKMWTSEYPPAEYFTETYGFDASADWFERARMPALRIPGCSSSFVSADGLVMTNHHCARRCISRGIFYYGKA